MEIKGIILNHKNMDKMTLDACGGITENRYYNCYDILKHKSNNDPIELCGYEINCQYVDNFILKNPNFTYVTSEDLGHIQPFNTHIKNEIKKLKNQDGWIEIEFNDRASDVLDFELDWYLDGLNK